MKTLFLIVPLCLHSAVTLAATSPKLSGTYTVLKSDCDTTGELYVGNDSVLLQTDATGLRIGNILYTGDGGVNSQPYFDAAMQFAVGEQRQNCMGDCYSLIEGAYTADGLGFKEVRKMAVTMSAPPVFAGETDLSLNGSKLTITTTDTGQFTPGPAVTCVLEKKE